jgi:hypothetical protein
MTQTPWYCITNKTGYDAEYEAQADGIVIYDDIDLSVELDILIAALSDEIIHMTVGE